MYYYTMAAVSSISYLLSIELIVELIFTCIKLCIFVDNKIKTSVGARQYWLKLHEKAFLL